MDTIKDHVRISHPSVEGVIRVSKCLKHQMLIDVDEMNEFLSYLEDLSFFIVSEPVKAEDGIVSKEQFLDKWSDYVGSLKQGIIPNEQPLRKYFSAILTKDPQVVYAMEVASEKYLIKPLRPVIQLQLHHFMFSKIDNKFYPMVLGEDSVTWGIQISYPQIFQHPLRHDFSKVNDSFEFPNTALFAKMAWWIRHHTLPTPFSILNKEGKICVRVPMRLGKKCFKWINVHPQFAIHGLAVQTNEDS